MTEPPRDDLAAIGLLDEPVRRRLYDWVVEQSEPVGREAAARAVGVTRGLAAFHLDKLAEAGLLESGYRRLTGRVGPGAGRPARVYWRASREFSVSLPERRYARAADLFASALERLGDGGPPPVLADAAREMGEQLGSGFRRGSGRARLARALDQGGYEPVADAHGTIRLRNCPFDALTDSHRSLVCGTNLALANGLITGAGADDVEPILDPQPGYCCVAFVPAAARPPSPMRGAVPE
jgi:predicted ArsR family transcriptional regulator